MNLEEIQRSVFDKQRDLQIKYVYYVVALSISSIGYAVYRSEQHEFNWLLCLWATPMISWALSTYIGLRYLRNHIYNMDIEMQWLHLQKSLENNLAPDSLNEVKKLIIFTEIEQSDNLKNERRNFRLQNILFFLGVGTFVAWHVTEMYCKTFCCH